jgi:hypothetical protein
MQQNKPELIYTVHTFAITMAMSFRSTSSSRDFRAFDEKFRRFSSLVSPARGRCTLQSLLLKKASILSVSITSFDKGVNTECFQSTIRDNK